QRRNGLMPKAKANDTSLEAAERVPTYQEREAAWKKWVIARGPDEAARILKNRALYWMGDHRAGARPGVIPTEASASPEAHADMAYLEDCFIESVVGEYLE